MRDPDLHVADFENVFSIIATTFEHLISKPGLIVMNVLVSIIRWGPKGDPVFAPLFASWMSSNPATHAYEVQLLSFSSGLLLLVIVPMLLIKFRFKERLTDYGLDLGNVRLGLAFFLLLIVIDLPLFYFGTRAHDMWAEYPLLYRGLSDQQIVQSFRWSSFIGFELLYASFFFVIEFTFRGYMLFGLKDRFGLYAVLFQMLSYTAGHLPKPQTEFIATPLWGFAVAAVSLRVGSIWYVFAA